MDDVAILVLLAEEYGYLLNRSRSFIAHRPVIAMLLSAVFSCALQFVLRWAHYSNHITFCTEMAMICSQ